MDNREFQEERLSDVSDIKKEKQKREEQYKKDAQEYKIWKKGQGKIPDESSDEYKQDLSERINRIKDKEQEQKAYVREREQLKAKKKRNISLTEEEELDLIEPKGKRADVTKRSLYTGKNIYLSKKPSTIGGSFNGGNSFNSGGFNGGENVPMELAPPPPPPPSDFYEAEPNPMSSEPIFEEAPPPPPPMFEDSDF